MVRRRSRDDAAMNLFPFMAVLICTVGALIMLLVMMVQQARVKAIAPSEEVLARQAEIERVKHCLLYTSPSPRDATLSRMPSSA